MKQFIVLIAILPLLLIFMMQFSYDQKNAGLIAEIQSIVYFAKEEAKQQGGFSKEMKTELKDNIAAIANVSSSDVLIECDEEIKYRYSNGQYRQIYYKISVPIREVMAGGELFGIDKEKNKYVYVIDSYTASEKL